VAARKGDGLGTTLALGVIRGVVSGGVLAAIATFSRSAPAASGFYAGLLAVPLALVESWALRHHHEGSARLSVAAWFVISLTVALAHFQAVYALGVLGSGSFDGGVAAIHAEFNRLWSFPPGDLSLIGLLNIHWDSLTIASVAVAFVCVTFSGPLSLEDARDRIAAADRGGRSAQQEGTPTDARPPATPVRLWWDVLGAAIRSYVSSLAVATIVVTCFIGLRDLGIVCFSPLIGLLIALYTLPVLAALAFGRVCGALVGARLSASGPKE
jgi:hypothetical protein